MLSPIISVIYSVVSTCVRIVMISSSAETDPGVTVVAILAIATKDADSCFRSSYFGTLALNPSMLQFNCKEALGPTTDFHVSRPSEV